MAEEIRGLSIKFDADFSDFRKNIKKADKDINSTQKQLKTLQNSLNIKWDSKKFTQAQQQAQKALEATEQKAELLRKRLAAMEAAGVTDETRDEYNYLSEQLNKTELDAQKLEKQLEDINNINMSKISNKLESVSGSLNSAAKATKGLSLTAAAGVAGLTAIGFSSINAADEIATLATKYDMSTEALQRFNYVALQTDTQSEDLYKAFVKVQAGVADLQTGVSSVSTKALDQLGLSFDQFEGKEDQFYAIIDALANMEDQSKMVSLANDIFGEKMATNIFPLIYAGTDAINEYKEEFESVGALTDEQIQELAELDNVMNQVKTQYANVAAQLGSGLVPIMGIFAEILSEDILPILKEIVEWFSGLDEGVQKFIVTALLLTAVLSPMLKLFSGIMGGISKLIKYFGSLEIATVKLYAKWALLVASVGSLFYLLSNWSEMNPVQKIVGLLGALTAAALSAAIAMGAFHSALSLGLAAAGIVAGIAAVVAAVKSAGKEAGSEVEFDYKDYESSVTIPEYNLPQSGSVSEDNSSTTNSYVDNSNVVINIEKNDYVSTDDIIRAVNQGLKQKKQSRT